MVYLFSLKFYQRCVVHFALFVEKVHILLGDDISPSNLDDDDDDHNNNNLCNLEISPSMPNRIVGNKENRHEST